MANAMDLILEEAKRTAQLEVSKNIAEIVNGLKAGKPISELVPTSIQVVLDKKQDAKERAMRTFIQNLLIDMAVAVLAVLGTALVTLDVTSKEAWAALAILLGKTAISAPVAYIMRLKKEPKAVEVEPTTVLVADKMMTPPTGPIPVAKPTEEYKGRG